jgi:hypothetical protein
MGGIYRKNGEMRRAYRNLVEKSEGKDSLRDLDVEVQIISTFILNK